MRLLRTGEAGSAALELAISHALLTRVSKGELPSTLRVYRPRATVAFGKLDRLSAGYESAVAAARDHGYEPVLRLPGGHAAAYNLQSIGIGVVWALDDPATGTPARFATEGERLAGALRGLGVDARVGEVPGGDPPRGSRRPEQDDVELPCRVCHALNLTAWEGPASCRVCG